jgi:hypothetical protein
MINVIGTFTKVGQTGMEIAEKEGDLWLSVLVASGWIWMMLAMEFIIDGQVINYTLYYIGLITLPNWDPSN